MKAPLHSGAFYCYVGRGIHRLLSLPLASQPSPLQVTRRFLKTTPSPLRETRLRRWNAFDMVPSPYALQKTQLITAVYVLTAMYPSNAKTFRLLLLVFALCGCTLVQAQQVTGVWKGKIGKKKVEVKIIQNGDSLTGTSYYFDSKTSYRRYTIKGYFDEAENSVVWWDDQLVEERSGLIGAPGKTPQLSVADFNCPGGGEMYLNGKATAKEEPSGSSGPVDLTKASDPVFSDEWNFVIDNYTSGTNDPEIIDSVSAIALAPKMAPRVMAPAVIATDPIVIATPTVAATPPLPEPASSITQTFTARKRVFTKEIPVEGTSIELRFYDNAQVDGDSISLFLDGRLLFEHIRLSELAYTIQLPVADLNETSELIMVAENLGTIPPNTSFMVALVGDKRYEAKLSSTENSSALIRLKKSTAKK